MQIYLKKLLKQNVTNNTKYSDSNANKMVTTVKKECISALVISVTDEVIMNYNVYDL